MTKILCYYSVLLYCTALFVGTKTASAADLIGTTIIINNCINRPEARRVCLAANANQVTVQTYFTTTHVSI